MGLDKVALIVGIMSDYEIDVAKWIACEIMDRATSTDIILAFPCLLTQIFLYTEVPELLDIDRFLRRRTTIDLGLIKDVTNPISKIAKMTSTMVNDAYESQGKRQDTERGGTPTETGQSKPQASYVAGTFSTSTYHLLRHHDYPHPGHFQL
ncbi:hypothetical protein FXO37_07617 [Capsicum annuum]|nr:hypothetical protein FXO37_07617 [Capsicum annuum]